MSNSQFQPSGNGLAITTSTTSAVVQITPANGLCVTNRSNFSAWVTWASGSIPTAAFPVPGNATGSWGMEIAPQAQVTIGTAYVDAYVAAVLLDDGSGNTVQGVMTFVPGDGL